MCCLSGALRADDQANAGGGFQANQFYIDGIGGDSISAFSGSAETPIKIGPTLRAGGGLELGLTLHHSSKIWHRTNRGVNNVYFALKRRGPFGVGWRLHVGRLYESFAGLVYESPDGAQHPILFGVQTPDPNSGVDPNIVVTYHGTTDSTYLRVEPMAGSTSVSISGTSSDPVFTPDPDSFRVYMGNGVVHTLARNFEDDDPNHSGDLQHEVDDFHGYYTTKIEKWDDPNAANDPNLAVGRIAISYDSSAPHCIDQIDFLAPDPNGVLAVRRSITFTNYTELGSWEVEGGYTKAITFPALSGQAATTATYDFDYGNGLVNLNYKPNDDPNWNVNFNDQLLLRKIFLPFPDPNDRANHPHQFVYDDVDPNGQGKTGELIKRILPTGAVIAYKYESYAWGNETITNFSREVTEKNLYLDPNYDPNTPDGRWEYERQRVGDVTQYAVVKDPFGNETIYYFTNGNISDPFPGSLTTKVEVYRGQNSYVSPQHPNNGELVLTNRTGFLNWSTGINVQPDHEWTIYHEHQNRVVQTFRMNPGPFGHFGRIADHGFEQHDEEQEFPGGSLPYRDQIVSYDEVDPNTDVSRWKLWFIHKLESSVTKDSAGVALRKTTMTYSDDGRVLSTTQSLNPADPNGSSEDIKRENVYDSITANLERSYVHKAGSTTPGFGSRYEYSGGVFLTKSRTLDPNQPTATSSQAFSYLEKDLIRESVSGAVLATIEPTGIRTDYHFDKLGRPISIVPTSDTGALSTDIKYLNEPAQNQPKWFEILTQVEQGSDPNNATAYTRLSYRFDRLGRVVEVRRRNDTNCDTLQRISYDIAGRPSFVTEWGLDPNMACPGEQLTPSTQIFSSTSGTAAFYNLDTDPNKYDPLSRVLRIVTGDGKVTRLSYAGPVTTVTLDVDGQDSTTRYEHDAFGNLVFVDAPEDPNTASADARYTYSVTGELLKAETISAPSSGSPVVQSRVVSYDGLGRLKSSSTPEGGTVQITAYDATGRPVEKLESDGAKVTLTYDAAGRILTSTAAEDITDPNVTLPRAYSAARDQARFFYDEAGVSNAAGRLTRVDSYDEAGALSMRRKLNYAGRNGRLSVESTTFAAWDDRAGIESLDKELRTCYFYDNLGMVSEFRYPAEATCTSGSAPADVARLTYSYRYGALDKIQDASRQTGGSPTKILDGVVYNAAGAPRKVTHGNGLATSIWPDVMGRPSSISVLTNPNGISNPSDPNFAANASLFRTGTYTYDGSANILSIGPGTDGSSADTFHYDLLSRLTSATVKFVDANTPQSDDLTYTYDAFGNMTAWTRDSSQATLNTSTATNRLTSDNGVATHYNQAGNLLGGTYDPNHPDSSEQYLFDERNRLLAARNSAKTYPVGQYAYDAGGMRFMKALPGTGERTFYVRDSGGNVLTEFTIPPAKHDESYQKDYFYALGRVIGMAEEKSPGPVRGLTASSSFWPANEEEETVAGGSITLNWISNSDPNITGYRVFRRATGSYVQVGGDLSSSATSFTQTISSGQLQAGATYYYKVAAFNSSGLEGIPSKSMKFMMTEHSDPASPSGLTLEARDRSVTLRWIRSSDDSGFLTVNYTADPATTFQGYQVYRQNSSGAWVKRNLVPLTEPVFHDLAVTPGTSYTYQIRAVDTYWQESAGTTNVTGQPADYAPPAPPTGVRALSGPGTNEITIVWNPSPESDVQEYKVYEKVDGSYSLRASITDPNSSYTHHDPNFSAGEHTYAVAAKDATSYSGLSADVKASLRNGLAVPGSQAATRFMRWSDHVPSAWIAWDNVTGASKYRVYRRDDDQPWSAYSSVGYLDPSTGPFKDYSVESCSAYAYMVRATDPNGYESADPNDEIFVERITRPNAPSAVLDPDPPDISDPNIGRITVSWDGGFIGNCQQGADGFSIVGWVVRTSLDPNSVILVDPGATTCGDFSSPSADIVINNPSIHSCSFRYQKPFLPRAFAVVAKLRNNNHADPNDPLRNFDSFISADICAMLDPNTTQPPCQDLSSNTGGGGGGGGGCLDPQECEEREGEILIRPHPGHARLLFEVEDDFRLYLAQSKLPEQTGDTCEPDTISSGTLALAQEKTSSRSIFQRAAPGRIAAEPLASTAEKTLKEREELSAYVDWISSGERAIGAASPKTFRFEFFHTDHVGNIRLVTGQSGETLARTKYLPFGIPAVATSAGELHQFAGYEHDSAIELEYLGRRYLSPMIGRFISADPLDMVALAPSSGAASLLSNPAILNRYSYGLNSPLNMVDKSGLFPWPTLSYYGVFSAYVNHAISIAQGEVSYHQEEGNRLQKESEKGSIEFRRTGYGPMAFVGYFAQVQRDNMLAWMSVIRLLSDAKAAASSGDWNGAIQSLKQAKGVISNMSGWANGLTHRNGHASARADALSDIDAAISIAEDAQEASEKAEELKVESGRIRCRDPFQGSGSWAGPWGGSPSRGVGGTQPGSGRLFSNVPSTRARGSGS